MAAGCWGLRHQPALQADLHRSGATCLPDVRGPGLPAPLPLAPASGFAGTTSGSSRRTGWACGPSRSKRSEKVQGETFQPGTRLQQLHRSLREAMGERMGSGHLRASRAFEDIGPDGGARGEAREHPGVAQRLGGTAAYKGPLTCSLTGVFLPPALDSQVQTSSRIPRLSETQSWEPFCLAEDGWHLSGTPQEFGR